MRKATLDEKNKGYWFYEANGHLPTIHRGIW